MRTVDRIRVHAPFARVFSVASSVTRWPAILPHYRWVRVLDGGLVEMAWDPVTRIVGSLGIYVAKGDGQNLCVRHMMTHTAVGEMGFFRHCVRSATVSADPPTIVFTMTRANFDRMRRERSDLAIAFDDFIIRVLADRIDFGNRSLADLTY